MEERRQTRTSTRRRAWRSSDEPEPKHRCPDLAAVPTRGTSARAFAGPGLDPRRTSINRIHPGLDPPLDPPYLGLRPLQNVTRSYLALSVTWAGTETERAPQQLARDRSWHPSLLGALVLRACYVTARSWEPWCSEMFTLPLALGSLGVENCLSNRSILGALVLRACYITARSWGP